MRAQGISRSTNPDELIERYRPKSRTPREVVHVRTGGSSAAFHAILATLALAGCEVEPGGPITVSAIGGPPQTTLSAKRVFDPATRTLVDATAQGLVRFDAAGQVEPGLAERWIVIDGGRSYIFRLREARWSDGRAVDAAQIARLLGRMVRRGSSPLGPHLTAVESVVAMTPQVIEVRLSTPRPDLLKLFAQPELALVRSASMIGTGPYRVVTPGPAPLLGPVVDPIRTDDDDEEPPARNVRLVGERAALAVLRFARERADLVTGGSFADWPLLATVALPAATLHVDPAVGLFGFAIVSRSGFLAEAANRAALSAAMDRAAITAAVAPTWVPVDRLLPDGLDSAAPPQVAPWTLLTLAERRADARARVAAWTGAPPVLRIALPEGPGATRLYGAVAASLRSIRVEATRVGMEDSADLRLVDAVAPYDNARWYLATACQPCGDEARDRLDAARTAPTLEERAARTAKADAAINADAAFIPLARPLRWSLVSPALTGWTANARAWHPLNRLVADPN